MTQASDKFLVCDMCNKHESVSDAGSWISRYIPGYAVAFDFCSVECADLFKEIEELCSATDNEEMHDTEDDLDTAPGLGPKLKN